MNKLRVTFTITFTFSHDFYYSFTEELSGNLSDYNGIRTHNQLDPKRTLDHLAKLAKCSSCVVSTYLYGAFDCVFLSCHVCVLE